MQLPPFIVVYTSIAVFATALLLLDTWPRPPSSSTEWLTLFVMVLPVVLVGEWLSNGLLKNALSAISDRETQSFQRRWWHVFYYTVMCILFATATVSIFEWTRRI